jgi:hypothetical protein
MRIDGDYGNASAKQFVHPLLNEGCAMAATDHRWITDILVYPARSRRKVPEMMLFPSMNRIVLHVCKWLAVQFDNPSRNAGITQLLFVERLVIVPPFSDVWEALPRPEQGQVAHCCGSKNIIC